MTFDQWKQQVNLLCIAKYGVDVDAFDDWLWHDDFKDGYSPADAFDYWERNMGPEA